MEMSPDTHLHTCVWVFGDKATVSIHEEHAFEAGALLKLVQNCGPSRPAMVRQVGLNAWLAVASRFTGLKLRAPGPMSVRNKERLALAAKSR
jgi:hypothetical protein